MADNVNQVPEEAWQDIPESAWTDAPAPQQDAQPQAQPAKRSFYFHGIPIDPDKAVNAVKTMGKIAGYIPGLISSAVETPVEATYDLATGKPTHVMKDVGRTIMGDAPGAAERMARSGVPKGPSVSDYIPGVAPGSFADISARGVGGTAADLLSGYAGTSMLSKVANAVGPKLYNSAWSKAEEVAQDAGKPAGQVADTMLQNRVAGTDREVKKQVLGKLNDLLEQRQAGIIDPVEASGSEANLPGAFSELRDQLNKAQTPGRVGGVAPTRDAASAFEKYLNDVENFAGPQTRKETATILRKAPTADVSARIPFEEGLQNMGTKMPTENPELNPQIPVTSYQTPDMKVSVNPDMVRMAEKITPKVTRLPGVGIQGTMNLKSSGYGKLGDMPWRDFVNTTEGQDLLKQYTGALRGETERLAEQYKPGMGGDLSKVNEQIGAMLSPSNVFDQKALSEAGKHGLSEIDLMSLANPKYFALKQLGKMPKSTWLKTKGGLGLMDLGNALPKIAPYTGLGTLPNSWIKAKQLNGGNQ